MRFWREIICNKQREKRAEIFLVTCDKIIICAEVETLQKIKSQISNASRFARSHKNGTGVAVSAPLHLWIRFVGGMKK